MNKAVVQTATKAVPLPDGGAETTAVLSMIERLTKDPGADIAKLEKMLDMQERVLGKQAEMIFFSAMNKCQSEMGRISADCTNNQTKSRYASYGALDRALRPIYTVNGISLSFDSEESDKPDVLPVVCYVSHVSGYTKKYRVFMPADGKGAKGGDVMTKTHATGAAMSYGMRYLLKMIFNVAIGEDDNDGNAPPVGEPDVSDWIAKIDESASMGDLKTNYTEAYNEVKAFKGAVASINRAKDAKKKELSK
jgi:hypothetical protein